MVDTQIKINLDPLMYALNEKKEDVLECIYESVRANTPVVTGHLRDSTYIESTPDGGEVGASAEYASIVEYRTGYFSAGLLSAAPQIDRIWRSGSD